MMQSCRQRLLLLCLTAAVAMNMLGNTAVAAKEVAPGVKNLTNMALSVIPHNVNSSVVTKLVIERNLITLNELDRQALVSYPLLEELHLDGNWVTAVPANYCSVVPHLRVLSLSRNNISRLDPEAFFGLDDLTELDLSHNQLTSLPSQLLRGMNGLKKLNLQENPWNCSCPLLSSIVEVTAANISIGAPGVTCAFPEAKAGKDLYETTAACYPSLTFTADPQTPATPVNTQQSRTTSAMLKTTLSSSQDQSNDWTPVFGNTWKFTACVVALALTTSMLIVCAIKGPSWYKLFHNYRHRRLNQQEDDEDNFASTVFSEIERYHNHQTFTFEHQNGQTEEEEDGYFEDPYIRREE
ncbi:leucine-rich repeat-containing protein 19 isoform X2 [Scophthalmus maximus]|uniref:leucine-rich repeat-containing protein 19 isoform X2 n=1 Tax=Scophthalmus maximus TaxID=52904 RepID=UPI001FA84DD5|nr:leucine-rich repeat-containing protein 19 isoform X2 [Scophthalmus maximus]